MLKVVRADFVPTIPSAIIFPLSLEIVLCCIYSSYPHLLKQELYEYIFIDLQDKLLRYYADNGSQRSIKNVCIWYWGKNHHHVIGFIKPYHGTKWNWLILC